MQLATPARAREGLACLRLDRHSLGNMRILSLVSTVLPNCWETHGRPGEDNSFLCSPYPHSLEHQTAVVPHRLRGQMLGGGRSSFPTGYSQDERGADPVVTAFSPDSSAERL